MVVFEAITGSTIVRYLDISNLPMGTYTATTSPQQVLNPAIRLTNIAVTSVDGQNHITVNKLSTPTTVKLMTTATQSASWSDGGYISDVKLVNTATGDVVITPRYKWVVTSSIS